MKINKMELLKEIMAVDFTIIDLSLYLNTHPADREAIAKHNSFVAQSRILKDQYEKHFSFLKSSQSVM